MKTRKRILAVLLCVVMTFSITHLLVYAESDDKYVGEIVELGSYPQSIVKDDNLIESLNEETVDEFGDTNLAGCTYCNYNGKWYKYEPLKWRIMTVKGDRAILISDKVIDSKPMNVTGTGNKWVNSFLQNWLTTTFKERAFGSLAELFDISVSAPSKANLENPDYGFSSDLDRIATVTDFASAEYAYYYWTTDTWTFGLAYANVVLCESGKFTEYFFQDQTNGVRPMISVNADSLSLEENIYNMGEESYSFGNYGDDDSEGGHCFGMSSTSAFYYLGLLDYPSQTVNTYSLPDNSITRKPICTYMAIQGSYRDKAMVAGGYNYEFHIFKQYNINSDWKEVVNYVKDHSHDGKGDLQIGFRKKGEGGHAINFLRYENVDGQDRIYAYDNNEPGKETYFYKAENGNVYQAVYSTFSGSIDCIALRDMNKYFENAKKYLKKNAVYSSSDAIKIDIAMYSPMDMDSSEVEYYMFELPDDVNEIEIVPLKDNAEFRYMDETYTFGEITENTVGILKLAESDDEEAVTAVEFNVIEDVPDEPDISENCTCSCHKTGFAKFIWSILNFFRKIFGMEQYRYCDCGKKHW